MCVYTVGAEKKRHCCVGIQGVSKLEQPQHLFLRERGKSFFLTGVGGGVATTNNPSMWLRNTLDRK